MHKGLPVYRTLPASASKREQEMHEHCKFHAILRTVDRYEHVLTYKSNRNNTQNFIGFKLRNGTMLDPNMRAACSWDVCGASRELLGWLDLSYMHTGKVTSTPSQLLIWPFAP